MWKSVGVLVVGSLLFGGAARGAGQLQEWKAPGMLGKVLASQAALFPGLEGATDEPVDENSGECSLKFFRPALVEAPVVNESNELRCSVKTVSGKAVQMRLPLSELPIEGWGNRAEENYRLENGLPLNFQVINNGFNSQMYEALKGSFPHRLVQELFVCDPSGRDCVHEFSIMQDTQDKYRKAHLSCFVDTLDGKAYRNQCIFLYP